MTDQRFAAEKEIVAYADRVKAALMGAFVADAATMGLHW
jgi:hypothetical protein